MITHIIENGVVVNSIVASIAEAQEAFPAATCIEATIGGKGWLWDEDDYELRPPIIEPQPVTVPAEITRWQALTILNQSGRLDAVETYVGSLTDRQAQIDFSAASIWRRDWPWLGDAATALGWTSEQVDQMFIAAAAL